MSDLLAVSAGQWVVYKTGYRFAHAFARADAVTPKLVKEHLFRNRYAHISRAAVKAVFDDKDAAEKLVQSIDGAIGEYRRREISAAESTLDRINQLIAAVQP